MSKPAQGDRATAWLGRYAANQLALAYPETRANRRLRISAREAKRRIRAMAERLNLTIHLSRRTAA